jgi:hypothetical protein
MVRFVISITTLPKRLPHIKPVIKSILKTNPEVDKVYLCLPYGDCDVKHIPTNSNKFHVIRCKDYGPITKILGVLDYETDPDTLILTLDDDVIVTNNIIKLFKKKAKLYPRSALSLSGWCYGSFPWKYQLIMSNKKDLYVDWVQGVHGILYRREFIDKKEVLKFETRHPLLFKNDDHRISAYLESKGISRISINHNPIKYFRNYGPASGIDAISGGTLSKSIKFWSNVDEVCCYMKKKGYYYRHSSCTYSIFFIIMIFIFLALILFLAGYLGLYCCNRINKYYIIGLVLLVLLIIIISFKIYKNYYFLQTDQK